jgi:benzoyl-CoA reductase/2-hydroxyglutaryl-CoA dehydratase subunit BcrC/BadD/HgdB
MGLQLLEMEGITSLADLGGAESIRGFLPEEFHKTFDMVQRPLLDVVLKDKNRSTAKATFQTVLDYFQMVSKELDSGKPNIQHYFALNPEFMWAMDLLPIAHETLGAIASILYEEGCEAAIDRLLGEGYPDHLCAAQTGTVGYLLDGLIPKPDVLAKNSAPCDPSNMMYEYTAHKFDVPLVVVESPYYQNERGLKYAVDELKRAIEELEKITGHTLDEDRLRKHVTYANEAIRYFLKLQELKKRSPMPDPAWHRPADTIFLVLLGTPMAATYYKTLYEQAKARADKQLSLIPEGKKEKRLAWGYAWMAYDLPFFDWLEEEHGATYTGDVLTYMPPHVGMVDTSSVETMIEGLAWRFMQMPMGRQTMGFSDVWVNDFVTIVKQFKVDTLVLAGHMACKHFWALNKLLSDKVKEETGVPTLRFEVDMFDKRFTPGAEMRRIMNEYFASQ